MRQLSDLSLGELEDIAQERDAPRGRAEQVFRWLHARGATTLKEMSDVPRPLLDRLAEEAPPANLVVERMDSAGDGTRKVQLRAADAHLVEAVLIPGDGSLTLCISSQSGCAMGCRFCATGTMKLRRHLGPGEIVDQVYRTRALLGPGEHLTDILFMGMGEPLSNYAAVVRAVDLLTHPMGLGMPLGRITISTSGIVPAIDRYAGEPRRANLAVSLNATTDDVRTSIMPVNRRWPIGSLLAALRRYPLEPDQRLVIGYVLLAGVNDSDQDARRLPGLLEGIRCEVHLIPLNPVPGLPYRRPPAPVVERFQRVLGAAGLSVRERATRGDDIDAACGQLAVRMLDPWGPPDQDAW